MAVNYTTKFSGKVAERWSKTSLALPFTNNDYDWDGADTVKVYSVNTVALTDYDATQEYSYGALTELGNTVQTMLLTVDKSFAFKIDGKSTTDIVPSVMEVGKALKRQFDEVVAPTIDTYIFGKMTDAAIANGSYEAAAITSSNAYTSFLGGQETLDEALVPQVGRRVGATPSYINFLKLDPSFTLASDLMAGKLVNGQYGDVDGLPVVKVPSVRLGSNVNFIIAHTSSTVAPMKLKKMEVVPGGFHFDGNAGVGRFRYDAFVLDAKVDGIYVHLKAEPSL